MEANKPEGWGLQGVTLTVPGEIVDAEEWRSLVNKLSCRLNRAGIGMIWRVELQKRKQPHIHAVVFYPTDRVYRIGHSKDWNEWTGWSKAVVRGEMFVEQTWHDVLEESGHWGRGAEKYSVKVNYRLEENDIAWWKYLVGHTSKKKKAQLGWKGRQWGVIGRSRILWDRGDRAELTRRQYYAARRVARRLCRMRRGLRRVVGTTDVMMSHAGAVRLIKWAQTIEDRDTDDRGS